jgi:hypothetical protein
MAVTNNSISVIWTAPIYTTVPGTTTPETTTVEETVTNNDVYDNDTGSTIDASVASQPYNFLLGTTAADGSDAVVDAGAAAVEPITDGEPDSTGTTAVPTDLGTYVNDDPADLDPAVFEAWTSEQQSEYMNYWIAQGQISGDAAVIGSGTSQITAVLSTTTAGTVYILNNLEATDFDSMSLADQEAVAATAYFQNTLAPELALTVNTNLVALDSTAPSTLASVSLANIQTEIGYIEGTASTTPVTTTTVVSSTIVGGSEGNDTTTTTTNADGSTTTTVTTYTANDFTAGAVDNGDWTETVTTTTTGTNELTIQTPSGPATISGMPTADKQAFIGELQLLQTQLASQAIVSDTQISTDVQAITARFTRAAAFWTGSNANPAAAPTTLTNSTAGAASLSSGVMSVDGNAAISQTYTTLIQQEQQILATETNASNVATSGLIGGVTPDVPTLIAYFQMNTDATEQAEITSDTSELQAINDELQEYSQMQALVNTTLEQFTASSTSTSAATLAGAASASDLTPAQLAVAEMFDSTTGTTPSPLDLLLGIARPTLNTLEATGTTPGSALGPYTQTQWNSFNTSLSNAVTQLQQQSQILTDNINEETQEQDNEFDLGNDALSKMSDMIDEIGRGLSD